MTISAILTAAFFFSYTQIRTPVHNVAMSCSICMCSSTTLESKALLTCPAICINMYYGTLYAYSAEVNPSAHRTTGSGVAVALNRIMGIISAVIGHVGGSGTVVPLYVCGGVFIAMAGISVVLPFEPQGGRSS